jgi:hypothetical protein
VKIDDALARRLVLLRRQLNRSHEPVLDGAAVANTIEHIGCTIPDDVLAYVAAIGSTSADAGPLHEIVNGEDTINTFYEAEDRSDWRSACGFDHVAFDQWGEWPAYWALFARSDRPKPIGVINVKTLSIDHFASVADYIDWRWQGELDTTSTDVNIASFAPSVRGAAAKAQRRVVHVKFGTGIVLSEAEGKLTIDFGDAGVKTIAEKFVKPG